MSKSTKDSIELFDSGDFTDDAFLGGRLQILQAKKGFRAGIDSVFLAASIPAEAEENVLECGFGTGVVSLCLLNRRPNLSIVGIENNPSHIELAHLNISRNGSQKNISLIEADIFMPSSEWEPSGLKTNYYAHAFANPPYHQNGTVRAPTDRDRSRSHIRDVHTLDHWVRFMIGMVRQKGTVTVIVPSDALHETLNAFSRRTGDIKILPIYTKRDTACHRIIVRGTKGAKAPARILSGLDLREEHGGFTERAERILRHGESLNLEF